MAISSRPVEASIRAKLEKLLAPSSLLIVNESTQHAHHAAMKNRAPSDIEPETHFALQVISDTFSGKTTVQRHRLIYEALGEEFKAGLHALSLTTKTPSEMDRQKAQTS
ncbi:bola-like protein-domain-containing protein [Cantharellus anzutake]|uniref:bola-like protein-domain-containing protein n=1 Tax=Cantharellus anzutake TaxID=1750568 RepID=UPI0019035057|nr:bola-like protein-domain-containing protein [Cantharellus anzutake]KAF8332071.1 bola-like protein-domain-containing protein [Cantharellus anzutake]